MAHLHGRPVIAPDLPGFGDSDPLATMAPTIADYAADIAAFTEGMGLRTVDVYGTHTGAAVAIELALAAPERVRRLVLDGVPLFDPPPTADFVARYAPRVEPDHDGGHLLWANNYCRDMLLFWPWFDKSAGARRDNALPEPCALHDWVLEVIKGLDAIPSGYAAAFAYQAAARLPRLRQPALFVAAAGDSLGEASRRAAALAPQGQLVEIAEISGGMAAPNQVARAALQFLDA
jgi:pimeloyl-ACP methyl ester carboxylesterase